MEIKDRELEFSPLSGRLTRDGVTVDVKIYRFAGTDDPWQLEVIDSRGRIDRMGPSFHDGQ